MKAPCKDCVKRSVEPNCHTCCQEYKSFKDRKEQINVKIAQERTYDRIIYKSLNSSVPLRTMKERRHTHE